MKLDSMIAELKAKSEVITFGGYSGPDVLFIPELCSVLKDMLPTSFVASLCNDSSLVNHWISTRASGISQILLGIPIGLVANKYDLNIGECFKLLFSLVKRTQRGECKPVLLSKEEL